MSDRIRDALTSQILSGELPPGSRLVELDLAKQFATSQTPVREALRELETLRLVESVPYRGTRVRQIGDEEMLEAYALRGVLEQYAGELAAASLKGQTSELETIAAALVLAAEQGDIDEYCRQNFEFHRTIVQRSGNQLLVQAWQALAFEARVRIQLSRISAPDLTVRAAEHGLIVDALRAGNGTKAGKLLREHARSCQQRWSDRQRDLPEDGEAGGAKTANFVQAGVFS